MNITKLLNFLRDDFLSTVIDNEGKRVLRTVDAAPNGYDKERALWIVKPPEVISNKGSLITIPANSTVKILERDDVREAYWQFNALFNASAARDNIKFIVRFYNRDTGESFNDAVITLSEETTDENNAGYIPGRRETGLARSMEWMPTFGYRMIILAKNVSSTDRDVRNWELRRKH